MTFELLAIQHRSTRRIRALFSERLALASYTAGLFSVVCQDGKGAATSVVAALMVTDANDLVELALDVEMATDSIYLVSVSGVTAFAGGSFSGNYGFRTPGDRLDPSTSVTQQDVGDLIYGRDILWSGDDMAEDPSGDIARVSGVDNVTRALTRRLESEGLPWAPGYGLKPRQAVDGPSGAVYPLTGQAAQQMLLDDRVSSAQASVDISANDGAPAISIDVGLVGGSSTTLTTPIPTA